MTTQAAPAQRPARGRIAAAWRSGPLSLPEFRLLTFGQLTSTVGDYCYAVALPWLVLSGGGTAASLGIVLACYGIPRAALTVPGGSLADRLGARRVMLASDLARCALTAALAALAVSHHASLAVVAPITALLGAASALFMPASMTMMPSLVDGERLTSANAVYTGFVQAGSMLGPVLGGVLVAATGPAPGFAVDAGSYLASAVSLALIAGPAGRSPRAATRSAGAASAGGAASTGMADAGGAATREATDSAPGQVTRAAAVPAGAEARPARDNVVAAEAAPAGAEAAGPEAAGVEAAGAGVEAVAAGAEAVAAGAEATAVAAGVEALATGAEAGPALAEGVLAEGVLAEGVPGSVWALLRRSRILQIILVVSVTANFALTGTTEVALPALAHARFGADGYGAVLTCVAAASIAGALAVARAGDRFRPATLIAWGFIAAGAAIAAAPFLGGLPGMAAGMAVFGLSIGFDNVVSVTLIQRWAPPELLGRVWGLLMLAAVGSFPVSTFIAGLLARHLGPVAVFPITGVLIALAMVFGLAQREFREFGTGAGEAGG